MSACSCHERGFLLRRGRNGVLDHVAVPELISRLPFDILFETPHVEVLHVLFRERSRVRDARGIEHAHQVRKALRAAIVRRRARQNERVTLGREKTRELPALAPPIGHVVTFVHDDYVPPDLLEPRSVHPVVLQRIDRNDAAIEVAERVPVRRDLRLHALEPLRIQSNERQREPRPELALKLREHAPDGDHENAPPRAPLDELRQEDPDLDRLSEPGSIRNQDARPQASKALLRGHELKRHHIERPAMPEGHLVMRRRCAPEQRLEIQRRLPVLRRLIHDEPRVLGPERNDLLLERRQKDRLVIPDELAHPLHVHRVPAHGQRQALGHGPFFTPDPHAGPGRRSYVDHRTHLIRRSRAPRGECSAPYG